MNIGNSSLNEIAEILRGAKKIALFPHVNMDGDALGSCVALSEVLSCMDKDCKIVVSESIPDNLIFLDANYEGEHYSTIDLESQMDSDVSVLIDSGELKRIPGREECFLSGKKKVSIDHHGTTEAFCDLNYIDPDSAATGQIIWKLVNILTEDGTKEFITDNSKKIVADALFAAITTDTGDFQYSNTQKESHEIVAKLYDWGLDANRVSVEIYESNRVERLKLTAEVLSKLELICDGKVAISYCSQEILRNTGGKMEESEWIAGDLRGIKGVEVAVFLKEEEPNTIKASLRSKKYFDVAELAKEFGGGGHVRASGYTVHMDLSEALYSIKKRLMESFSS